MKSNKCVVSIDLEMNQPSGKIIQIGISVGNIETYEHLGRKNWIVDPKEEVTAFIENLTGITNDRIKIEGVPLEDASSSMFKYLSEFDDVFINPVTWGGGDSIELRNQLENFDDRWPFGRRWIDVKTLFVAWQMSRGEKPVGGLSKSMNKMGLVFDGRKHDAEDDAFNTLRMYFKFLEIYRGMEVIPR